MDSAAHFGNALLNFYLNIGCPKDSLDFIPNQARDVFIADILCFLSILILAYFNNKIKNQQFKKWFGTLTGIYVVALVHRRNVWHYFISVFSTIFIISHTPRRYCHIAASVTMFSYITISKIISMWKDQDIDILGHYLTMCIAFNIVGLSFEINISQKDVNSKENKILKLNIIDMVHYTFNVTIILLAPYVTYRVYEDMIKLPYCRAVKKKKIIAIAIVKVVILSLTSIFMTRNFPLKYIFTSQYASESLLYKNMYAIVLWASIRINVYRDFSLSHMQCYISGLGAYPIKGKNKVCYGPTEDIQYLEKLSEKELENLDYDFNTVQYVDMIEYELTLTLSSALKKWNLGYQYWLSKYLYLYFPKNNSTQHLRELVKFFISALWHGMHVGMFISVVLCVMHMIMEHVFWDIHQKMTKGWKSRCFGVVIWLMKLYLYACWMMPLFLISLKNIILFFSTIYYTPFVILVFLYVLRYLLLNYQKNDCKKQQ